MYDTITREEFDRRLEQSTQTMRDASLGLEAKAVALEDLIARYSSVLERLEADAAQESPVPVKRRDDLRNLLTELAMRTSAVAASL